jgi:predicted Zn-dependent peptidase
MNLRLFGIASLVCIGLATSAYAQEPASAGAQGAIEPLGGVQLKNRAPVNKQVLAPKLPRTHEATLENGLRIVLIEDRALPTFVLQLVIDRGSIADPQGKEGLAQATAAQLRQGTRTRSSEQIAEALDSIGASFGARADLGSTIVTVSGLTEHLDATLDIFGDALRNPTFPQSELEPYKQRLISQMHSQRASSQFLAQEQLVKAIYGEFPASRLLPPESSILSLTSADLAAFHASNFAPDIAMVLVAGDVTLAGFKPKLEEVAPPSKGRVFVIDRPGAVQTSLVMGSLAIVGDDPDRFAISVMNRILGGSPASRLFTNLREEKGYTYGAYSSVSSNRYPGVASASAEVRTEVTAGAMHEFMAEFERIAKQPVSDVELANAKRAIVGGFALSLENPQSFLGYVFQQKLYGFPPGYWEQYPKYIDAVTKEDVARVATKYFDPSRMQIVAVGEAAKIHDTMAKFGAVQEARGEVAE